MTKTASVNGVEIAHTDAPKVVEGNQYFPPSDIKQEYFKPSAKGTTTHCPWKGDASYYDLHVDGKVIEDAAWYYPSVITDRAQEIKGFIAFYTTKGVKVE
ncbi:hypothetical protein BCR35DRAFT_295877 [Leucosporidium creatinivorum]|uniref:DUF427 domain-containing protein n=1 Tax=Leucosporidium creatinivorum TaxID=106004 RepID=A0A1Y2DGX6_9BASI|nr:hypothetical protein BCR35DRAFT_295877 [Leucosporidium creatinivorum]